MSSAFCASPAEATEPVRMIESATVLTWMSLPGMAALSSSAARRRRGRPRSRAPRSCGRRGRARRSSSGPARGGDIEAARRADDRVGDLGFADEDFGGVLGQVDDHRSADAELQATSRRAGGDRRARSASAASPGQPGRRRERERAPPQRRAPAREARETLLLHRRASIAALAIARLVFSEPPLAARRSARWSGRRRSLVGCADASRRAAAVDEAAQRRDADWRCRPAGRARSSSACCGSSSRVALTPTTTFLPFSSWMFWPIASTRTLARMVCAPSTSTPPGLRRLFVVVDAR